MDSFEINKVLGALLGTCLILLAVHIASGAIFTPPVPAKPGYEIEVKEEHPGEAKPAAAAAEQPFDAMLATASAERGAQVAKQCQICHNLQQGQGPKIGPDLWDVVGRPVASEAGFAYSDSIKKIGGDWTYEKLNDWITDPKKMAPDTKMIFPGEHSAKKRADILAYLQTLSDKPVPFPK